MSHKLTKGKQKKHDLWLEDEINDYAFPEDPPEFLKEYEEKWEIQAKNADSQHISQDNTTGKKKSKKRGLVSFSPDFNFLLVLKNLPENCLVEILYCLGVKELPRLLCTCKGISKIIDTDAIWTQLCVMNFYLKTAHQSLKNLIPKSLFRSSSFYAKPNLTFNSEFFLKSELPSTSKLAKSLQDLTILRTNNSILYIQDVIHKVKMSKSKSFWTSDLKISLDLEKNIVYLWLAGFLVKDDPKARGPNKKPPIEVPESFVIKKYGFPEEQQICSTSFVEDKYLIIEIKENQKDTLEETPGTQDIKGAEYQEEIKQDQNLSKKSSYQYTFFAFDIEKELKYLVRDAEYPSATTCVVYPEELSRGTKIDSDNQPRGSGLVSKILNDEEMIFFEQDTAKPLIVIYDVKAKKIISKANLELKQPVYDIIPSKKVQNKFYTIDQSLALNEITVKPEGKMDIRQIFDEKLQNLMKDQIGQNKSQHERFPRAHRIVYYDIYKSLEEKDPFEIEYIILNKSNIFFFVNLETGEIYDYIFREPETSKETIVKNWHVYKNRLCVLSTVGLSFCSFSMQRSTYKINEETKTETKFEIEKYLVKGLTGWYTADFLTHWVVVNDCYTMIAFAYSTNFSRIDMRVAIVHTQNVPGNYSEAPSYANIYDFDLTNILTQQLNQDEQPQILQEKVQVKLEDQTIFVKGSQRSFFGVLERLGNKETNPEQKTFIKSLVINLKAVNEIANKIVDEKAKEKIHLTQFDKLHENENQKDKYKQKIRKDWSHVDRKEDGKEERQQERVNKGKGDNYHKNVQQNERLIKQG